ncbi:MAG: hypothetical protein WCZ89_06675 [Phycisphaerae bacterium]
MEISNSLFTHSVDRPDILPNLNAVKNAPEEQKKQLAMEFESIFVNKLLDEMTRTVGSMGYDEDGTGEQVKGLFNLCLSQYIGKNGGMGLWKDIYESFKQISQSEIQQPGEFDNQI